MFISNQEYNGLLHSKYIKHSFWPFLLLATCEIELALVWGGFWVPDSAENTAIN